jgi:Macrocin-O-methyltransferase (TylF)
LVPLRCDFKTYQWSIVTIARESGTVIKYWLTRVGERLSSQAIYNLNAAINYLEVGRWMHRNGYDGTHRFDRREQLFDIVGSQVGQREVLYLEFGVFQGAATMYWSKLLRNPSSKLHGFDSFEGLPQNWLPHRPKGHFSLQGKIPQIDDARVRFIKGWFEQTLPDYELPVHEVLVLNFDADLYSPTIFVLNVLETSIVPGTYIYFDEFNHQFHELRAFDEFIKRTGMKFKMLGATRTLQHVIFQRTS